MRARVPRSRVTHDRWLVSYADFITLLFAFFVVLFATAKADQKKQVQVAQAIDSAFKSLGIFPDATRKPARDLNPAGGNRAAAHSDEHRHGRGCAYRRRGSRTIWTTLRRDLQQRLSNQVAQHTVSIQMGRDGLVISLREAGFFDSGSAMPRPEALATLRQIAASLARTPVRPARGRPHRQCANSHRQLRFQLGAFVGARHTHRAALSRSSRHSGRPAFGRRICRIPSCGQQRNAGRRAPTAASTWSYCHAHRIDFSIPRPNHADGAWRKITDDDGGP